MEIIGRWSRDQAYCYIRPITSKFKFPGDPAKQYWVVRVELRTPQYGCTPWDGEGYDLDEVILELGKKVPRRPMPHPGSSAPRPGWLAPRKVHEAEVKDATKKLKGKSKKSKKKSKKG